MVRLPVTATRWSLCCALLAFIIVPGGCDSGRNDSPQNTLPGRLSGLRDATGRLIEIRTPVRRVVSLAPNLTEILWAVGAGDLVVGRTRYCDYPPQAASATVVADLMTIDYEAVLTTRPDLVLMSFAGNTQAGYNKLRGLGLQPVALESATLDGVINTIDTVGALTGHAAQAGAITAALRRTVDSIRALVRGMPRRSVFVVIDKAPLLTVSRGFIAEQVQIAGGDNIVAGSAQAYPAFSREELLRRDPDVILIPSPDKNALNGLLDLYPEWRRLKAVRLGCVYVLPPDVVTRPGPRLGQSLRLIYNAIHTVPALTGSPAGVTR